MTSVNDMQCYGGSGYTIFNNGRERYKKSFDGALERYISIGSLINRDKK